MTAVVLVRKPERLTCDCISPWAPLAVAKTARLPALPWLPCFAQLGVRIRIHHYRSRWGGLLCLYQGGKALVLGV